MKQLTSISTRPHTALEHDDHTHSMVDGAMNQELSDRIRLVMEQLRDLRQQQQELQDQMGILQRELFHQLGHQVQQSTFTSKSSSYVEGDMNNTMLPIQEEVQKAKTLTASNHDVV